MLAWRCGRYIDFQACAGMRFNTDPGFGIGSTRKSTVLRSIGVYCGFNDSILSACRSALVCRRNGSSTDGIAIQLIPILGFGLSGWGLPSRGGRSGAGRQGDARAEAGPDRLKESGIRYPRPSKRPGAHWAWRQASNHFRGWDQPDARRERHGCYRSVCLQSRERRWRDGAEFDHRRDALHDGQAEQYEEEECNSNHAVRGARRPRHGFLDGSYRRTLRCVCSQGPNGCDVSRPHRKAQARVRH